MDIDDLRCFLAATAAPSFRSAARRVALSPAAFSTRIQRLEESLGAKLFHRTTRTLSLTTEGLRLLPHAKQTLDHVESCRHVVHSDEGPPPFSLTIGTRYELGLSWLCPALPGLAETRPERTLHLYMGDSPDLFTRVERGDIDCMVSSARITLPRLEYAALHEERYVFVGTRDPVSGPESVSQTTLIDVSPDLPLFRYLLDALPDARPWPFERLSFMGGIGAIRAMVLQGVGVAVLPEYFIREDLAAGRLRVLMPEVALKRDAFRLIWRSGHPLTHELESLADVLRRMPLQ